MTNNLIHQNDVDGAFCARRGFLGRLLGFSVGAALFPWQKSSSTVVAAQKTEKLDEPKWLGNWKDAPRKPVCSTEDQTGRALLDAMRKKNSVQIFYASGDFQGFGRTVTPLQLFSVEGYRGIYLEAWCHSRGEVRTFALDRINFEPITLAPVYPLRQSAA